MPEPPEKQPQPLNYSPPPRPTVPLYREILSGILVLAGIVFSVVGIFAASEAARANIWTVAFGLIVWGLVIRFQHVRF
jgi:hypothetical protein